MRAQWLAVVLLMAPLAMPARAEDLTQLRQLLATGNCPGCDLSGAGLVMADLHRANLQGADLSGANLSRANLGGANLGGANLAGAVLYGTRLTGANLTGANLTGANLQEADLGGANFSQATLANTNLQEAQDLPPRVGKASDFLRWAFADTQANQLGQAIENYTQAIDLQPNLAVAYLGRSSAYYEIGNYPAARHDSQQAAQMYLNLGDLQGYQVARSILEAAQVAPTKPTHSGGISGFLNSIFSLGLTVLQSVGGLAF